MALLRFSSTCINKAWPLTTWNLKWRDAMAHFRLVVFNTIISSFGSWLTGSVNWTTCRQFGQGPVSQTSCSCLFCNLIKPTPEIAIWRTNLVSQTTNKWGNGLNKTKAAVGISDFLQMNIKFTVQNRFSLTRCSLWNGISHTEKKKICYSSHIFIEFGSLCPFC